MSTFALSDFQVGKIQAQEWLQNEDLQHVLHVLNAEDKSLKALIVGGAVRNALLGFPIKDIDIATAHTPQHVMEICEKTGLKTFPTGLQHGTVTVVYKGQNYEVTTLRRDEETNGRHAKVAFTNNWAEDAARRDFTMNALYLDGKGHIYDFLGGCLDDAQAAQLRFVGDPEKRIEEDALRILRYFRFWSYYAKGVPDRNAIIACVKKRYLIKGLSKERITAELTKILIAPKALETLLLMADNHICNDIVGNDLRNYINILNDIFNLQSELNVEDAYARLSFIYKLQDLDYAGLGQKLILSNAEKKFFKNLMAALNNKDAVIRRKKLRFMIFDKGRAVAQQFLIFNHKNCPDFQNLWTLAQHFEIPECPVSGDDLKANGYEEGKEMGQALKALKQKWIDSDFALTREELLAQLPQ